VINQDDTDDALVATHTSLVTDLAAVLDLAAGTAAATQSAVYTDDLAGLLDLDAGLAAILTVDAIAAMDPAGTVADAPSAADHLAGESDAPTGQPEPAYDFGVFDAASRFTLRTRRSYGQLRSALHLDCDLNRCRSEARALLVRVATSAKAYAHVRRLSRLHRDNDDGHQIARSLASARVLAIDRGLSGDLIVAVTSALNHAIALDRAWRHATPIYNHTDDRALQAARRAAHDLAETLGQAVTHARAEVNGYARDLNIDLLVDGDSGNSNGLKTLLERVADLGDNFIGADLRKAHIEDAADMTGIRWSLGTSWPPAWAGRIRAMSVEIGPGIFLVAGDAGKRSLTQVHT
jgi:hypothetical protein